MDKTTLAIDPGTKFCGLAICKNYQAFPLKTLKFNRDFQRLKQLLINELLKQKPDIIVLGFSKYPKMQTLVKEYYLPIIKQSGLPSETPIYLLDETNTTTLAKTLINQSQAINPVNPTNNSEAKVIATKSVHRDKNKYKARGIIDKASAIMLLYKAHEKGIIICD